MAHTCPPSVPRLPLPAVIPLIKAGLVYTHACVRLLVLVLGWGVKGIRGGW